MQLFARTSQQTRDSVVQRLRTITAPRAINAESQAQDSNTQPGALLHADPAVIKPIAKIALVAIMVVAIGAWLNRPHDSVQTTTLTPGVVVPAPRASASASIPDISTTVVVDVEGDVHRPGLYTLPANSRIAQAIEAAGGVSKKVPVGSVNLAEHVTDGQLIVVGATATAGGVKADVAVNLNVATAGDLDALPGVGPVLAARIISWRTEHTSFHSIDELQEVPGIGPKVFANLKPLVRV